MSKQIIFSLLLLVCANSWSQQLSRHSIKGKVIASVSNREGITVINTKTEKYAITDQEGYFAIPVQEGDTLMFAAVQYNAKKVAISCEDVENDMLFVNLQSLVHQLDEVVIVQYKNINAVALGIIPAGQRAYTPAERKLKAGTATDAKIGLNTSVGMDPILNMFSGRAAMLRRDVETEKKEKWLDKIQQLYNDNFFIATLKIPMEYIKGFQYFLVEDKNFISILSSKNKVMATFVMGELAVKYIDLNCL